MKLLLTSNNMECYMIKRIPHLWYISFPVFNDGVLDLLSSHCSFLSKPVKVVSFVVMPFVICYTGVKLLNGNALACVMLTGDKIWNYFPCSRLFCAYPTESKYCWWRTDSHNHSWWTRLISNKINEWKCLFNVLSYLFIILIGMHYKKPKRSVVWHVMYTLYCTSRKCILLCIVNDIDSKLVVICLYWHVVHVILELQMFQMSCFFMLLSTLLFLSLLLYHKYFCSVWVV